MHRITAFAIALALATPAAAFNGPVRLPVAPAGGQDFIVGFGQRAGLQDYWCAAGRYVQNDLGLPSTTRVYRLSPEPRKRGQGITFTLDPARSSGETGFTVFGGRQDGSFSAAVAIAQNCYTIDIKPFGFDD